MANILRKPRSNPASGMIEVYYQIQTKTGLVTLGYVSEAAAQDRLTLERAAEIRARQPSAPPPVPSAPATLPDWLAPEQAAAWLGVSRMALDEMQAAGQLAGAYFQVGATLRYDRSALRAVLLRPAPAQPASKKRARA